MLDLQKFLFILDRLLGNKIEMAVLCVFVFVMSLLIVPAGHEAVVLCVMGVEDSEQSMRKMPKILRKIWMLSGDKLETVTVPVQYSTVYERN